jgi:hypothetical protein
LKFLIDCCSQKIILSKIKKNKTKTALWDLNHPLNLYSFWKTKKKEGLSDLSFFREKSSHPNLYNSTKILANQEDSELNKEADPKSKNKYWALDSCMRSFFLVSFVATLSNYPLVQCSTALATIITFFLGMLK